VRNRLDPPGRLYQPCPLPFDYELRKPPSPGRLFLLLHGHGESGKKLFEKFAPVLPEGAAVLAPNAPFPIAEWVGTDWKTRELKLTYCWHFYEPAKHGYLVPPDTGLAHLEQGVRALGLADLPKTVIGFSQGGYVAHYAAQRLSRVEHVIAIGCEFMPDEIQAPAAFRLDGIFGEKDRIVDRERAIETHQQAVLKARGGQLYQIKELGHSIDDRVVAKVAELLTA